MEFHQFIQPHLGLIFYPGGIDTLDLLFEVLCLIQTGKIDARPIILMEDLNETYFTEIDKRSTDVFPVFSKKVEMISQHPDSSYKFIYDNDLIAYVKIENPDEFWKLTKYAVIELK